LPPQVRPTLLTPLLVLSIQRVYCNAVMSFLLPCFDLSLYWYTTTTKCFYCAGCQQWTSSPNTNFQNGQSNPASTIQACQAACIGNNRCSGFDWVPAALSASQRCWLSGSWSGQPGNAQGVTHYFLNRNCAGKLHHFICIFISSQ